MSNEEEVSLGKGSAKLSPKVSAKHIEPAQSGSVLETILSTPQEKLIPWEMVELPSKGLYYGWDTGNIQVRAFSASLQRAMANQRIQASGTVLDSIFADCCQFPEGFNPDELLVGDQFFLLYYLRNISFGPIYEFAVTCPNIDCRATSTHSFDMTELASTINWADPTLGNEPFRVDLPYMSKVMNQNIWVDLRFLRARDVSGNLRMKMAKKKAFGQSGGVRIGGRKAEQRRRQEQRSASMRPDNDSFTDNLALSVVSVMGDDDRNKIDIFCEKLHITDVHHIREWVENNMPGIESVVVIGCSECGNEYSMQLPITPEFFRPEGRGRIRT